MVDHDHDHKWPKRPFLSTFLWKNHNCYWIVMICHDFHHFSLFLRDLLPLSPLKRPFLLEKSWQKWRSQSRNVVINFWSVDVDHDQTLEKIFVGIGNGHSWSIITPYLDNMAFIFHLTIKSLINYFCTVNNTVIDIWYIKSLALHGFGVPSWRCKHGASAKGPISGGLCFQLQDFNCY